MAEGAVLVSTQVTKHPLDAELGDLWYARDTLDNPGWVRLYDIVNTLLEKYPSPLLSTLKGPRKDYVQDFFCDKVLRPDAVPARIHVGALKVFYNNFLKDEIKRLSRYRKNFSDNHGIEEDEGGGLGTMGSYPAAQDNPWGDPGLKALVEEGHEIPLVLKAAKKFLSDADEWVPVYLAFSFCSDAEKKEPLVHLANRLGIPSYHTRAVDLGINWSPGKGGKTFGETQLGRWVERDLGISLAAENHALVLAAFKILCFEALNWAEALEANQ